MQKQRRGKKCMKEKPLNARNGICYSQSEMRGMGYHTVPYSALRFLIFICRVPDTIYSNTC